jgi:hypothetical protein
VKRNTMLKILNPLLAVLVLNQVTTALIHDAIPHEVFGIMHMGGGFTLAGLATLHLILNWNWVKSSLFRRS